MVSGRSKNTKGKDGSHSIGGIPAIGRLVNLPELADVAEHVGRPLLTKVIREVIEQGKQGEFEGATQKDIPSWCLLIRETINALITPHLRRVINATGVVVHTNLGRAPLSKGAAEAVARVAQGYCNLEYDLETGRRGDRQKRLRQLMRLVTGAEDALAVNNNAAAIFLVLRVFAQRKDVVVSRGELIEIGDSFRLPEIMKEGGARLVEVGTTNRTRLSDYEKALSERTAILLKIHRSNFTMHGFVEEVDAKQLAEFAHQKGLLAMHDLGSGLLCRPQGLDLAGEPTVQDIVATGMDLVTFSGDKLLGGPQAGLIAGKQALVQKLARAPLMRALRPGRITLAALEQLVLQALLSDRFELEHPVFAMIKQSDDMLHNKAQRLAADLAAVGIDATLTKCHGQIGGGALPGLELAGWAVQIGAERQKTAAERNFAGRLFKALRLGTPPVIGILREGRFCLDVRAIAEEELPLVVQAVKSVWQNQSAACCKL